MPQKRINPRNYPKQERSKQTRADILQATARLLTASDEASVTTNHIAKTTGISVGTLYKHYPNKDAILSDLIDQYMESDSLSLQTILRDGNKRDPKKTRERLIDWIIETHKEQHKLRSVLYSNLGRLLKNQKAFEVRRGIANELAASGIGNTLSNPTKTLMLVAAMNAMIHVLSQLPATKSDWDEVKKIGLKLLQADSFNSTEYFIPSR